MKMQRKGIVRVAVLVSIATFALAFPPTSFSQGTHVGCEHGVCGACTVLVNGERSQSCLLFAVQAEGSEILTVEGLARDALCTRCRKHFPQSMDCSAGSARQAC